MAAFLILRQPNISRSGRNLVQSMAVRFDGIVQQQAIAAAHHLNAVGDEPAGLVLVRVDFPILFRAAESDLGIAGLAYENTGRCREESEECAHAGSKSDCVSQKAGLAKIGRTDRRILI